MRLTVALIIQSNRALRRSKAQRRSDLTKFTISNRQSFQIKAHWLRKVSPITQHNLKWQDKKQRLKWQNSFRSHNWVNKLILKLQKIRKTFNKFIPWIRIQAILIIKTIKNHKRARKHQINIKLYIRTLQEYNRMINIRYLRDKMLVMHLKLLINQRNFHLRLLRTPWNMLPKMSRIWKWCK